MKKTTLNIVGTFLIIIMIGTNIYTSIANSIQTESIKTSIQSNLLTGFIFDDNGNKTKIFQTILELTTLDEETVIKLMENETADEIITDIVNSIYDYNLTGDETVKYKKEDIIRIVEENMDKILREINYSISARDRQEVINYTHNNTQYIIDTIYSTDIGDYTKW